MKPAYYNEMDPLKAAVLREAIAANAIAPGDVDERSIVDVSADDLVGYGQCHFFAGGGFWSLVFRKAGIPDDCHWWSGSCPCPSFSAAGKGGGFSDPRHLWPDWARLIRERKPAVVFGEQADDSVGYGWLDLVQTDLEAQAYSVGKVVLGAHSVGAPHIRQRLYFVANAEEAERGRTGSTGNGRRRTAEIGRSGASLLLEDSSGTGLEGRGGSGCSSAECSAGPPGVDGLMGNATGERCGEAGQGSGRPAQWTGDAGEPGALGHADDSERRTDGAGGNVAHRDAAEWHKGHGDAGYAGPVSGFWRDAEWIPCRVPKVPGAIEWRPIERGTFPLVARYPERVAELRIAGDAINIETATAFVMASMDAIKEEAA